MPQVERFPDLKAIDDGVKLEAIMDAVSTYDVPSSHVWAALDELSTHTHFEEIDASPEGIFEKNDGKNFEVVATIYVTLNYGDKNDQTSMSDSYPALVFGEYDTNSGKAIISHIEVDTSSFYN